MLKFNFNFNTLATLSLLIAALTFSTTATAHKRVEFEIQDYLSYSQATADKLCQDFIDAKAKEGLFERLGIKSIRVKSLPLAQDQLPLIAPRPLSARGLGYVSYVTFITSRLLGAGSIESALAGFGAAALVAFYERLPKLIGNRIRLHTIRCEMDYEGNVVAKKIRKELKQPQTKVMEPIQVAEPIQLEAAPDAAAIVVATPVAQVVAEAPAPEEEMRARDVDDEGRLEEIARSCMRHLTGPRRRSVSYRELELPVQAEIDDPQAEVDQDFVYRRYGEQGLSLYKALLAAKPQ